MHGFEWKDQRGVEGVGFVRALKTLLTSHLPALLPSFEAAISDQFEREVMKHKMLNGNYRFCLLVFLRNTAVGLTFGVCRILPLPNLCCNENDCHPNELLGILWCRAW